MYFSPEFSHESETAYRAPKSPPPLCSALLADCRDSRVAHRREGGGLSVVVERGDWLYEPYLNAALSALDVGFVCRARAVPCLLL